MNDQSELLIEDVMPCCVVCKRTVEVLLQTTGEALSVIPIYKDEYRMDAMGFIFACKDHQDQVLGKLIELKMGNQDLTNLSVQ